MRSVLVRTTAIWLFLAAWLLANFFCQLPPGGPYTELLRNGFALFASAVMTAIALVLVVGWVVALRR